MDSIPVPSPAELREKAIKIVTQRDYQLDGQADSSGQKALLLAIIDAIQGFFDWIFALTAGLPVSLWWTVVIGLLVLLLLLVTHIVYTLLNAIRAPKRISDPGLDSRRKKVDPGELELKARAAALQADYIAAVRLLFRACVVRLELREKKSNRPGITNRELLSRYRNRPDLSESLSQFVETIDRKWYGDEICSRIDYDTCEQAYRAVCRAIGEPAHALGT